MVNEAQMTLLSPQQSFLSMESPDKFAQFSTYFSSGNAQDFIAAFGLLMEIYSEREDLEGLCYNAMDWNGKNASNHTFLYEGLLYTARERIYNNLFNEEVDEILVYLIDKTEDLNLLIQGLSYLHLACLGGLEKAITALLCRSANVICQTHNLLKIEGIAASFAKGSTPLHWLFQNIYNFNDMAKLERIKHLLLSHGALMTIEDEEGNTPLGMLQKQYKRIELEREREIEILKEANNALRVSFSAPPQRGNFIPTPVYTPSKAWTQYLTDPMIYLFSLITYPFRAIWRKIFCKA